MQQSWMPHAFKKERHRAQTHWRPVLQTSSPEKETDGEKMNNHEIELAQLQQKIRDMRKIKYDGYYISTELSKMKKRAKKLQMLIQKGNR